MEAFNALKKISLQFAQHGPGKLPDIAVQRVHAEYLVYRDAYNSDLANR